MIIDRLWKSQPGKYFCLATKNANGKWQEHFFSRSEIGGVREFIEDNKDKDIWFCPHGFSQKRRLKENAVPGSLLWADLDEADPNKIKPRPTIAIESSPGRFVGLWTINGTMTESMNRRLTYLVGADKSGWDFTQVLRIPGTTNYKYQSMPRVRMLWMDGPSYSLKEIENLLPDEEEDEGSGEEGDAAEIFKRYEKSLPAWCRRELLNGKPSPGTRSEMIWKIGQTLIESGISREEAFVLLKASPWNKFKGRRGEDQQLRREVDKAVNRHLKGGGAQKKEEKNGYKFLMESMDQVEEENIDWIWYPYLARGELTILEGDPGLGKSYLAQMVAGAICDGEKLPAVKKLPTVSGIVAYFDIENSAGSVTKKRLTENNVKKLSNFFQDEQPFSIDNVERLEEVYEAIEKRRPTLVVFDTLNTYIGKADVHKSSESQQAFGTFRDIAKRFNCSVLVLRHLTKSSKERALYRGQGSIAFAGLARVVMTVGSMPDDPETRVMAVTKINVTRPPKALTFRITALPDTLSSQDRSKFSWGEFVDLTSDDIIGGGEHAGKSDRDDATQFLKDILDDGPLELRKVERMAEARSLSVRTVHRAADEIGVVKKVSGFGKEKHSTWSLPEPAPEKAARPRRRPEAE